jgi:hypothetical protein
VIKKPCERGGHSPRWNAEPVKIIIKNNNNNKFLNINASGIQGINWLHTDHRNDAFWYIVVSIVGKNNKERLR